MPADAKARLEPALLATNGYDFRGNVDGDVYRLPGTYNYKYIPS